MNLEIMSKLLSIFTEGKYIKGIWFEDGLEIIIYNYGRIYGDTVRIEEHFYFYDDESKNIITWKQSRTEGKNHSDICLMPQEIEADEFLLESLWEQEYEERTLILRQRYSSIHEFLSRIVKGPYKNKKENENTYANLGGQFLKNGWERKKVCSDIYYDIIHEYKNALKFKIKSF